MALAMATVIALSTTCVCATRTGRVWGAWSVFALLQPHGRDTVAAPTHTSNALEGERVIERLVNANATPDSRAKDALVCRVLVVAAVMVLASTFTAAVPLGMLERFRLASVILGTKGTIALKDFAPREMIQ